MPHLRLEQTFPQKIIAASEDAQLLVPVSFAILVGSTTVLV